MPYKKLGLAAVLLMIAAINGCVSPGRLEVNDVYRFQQHILEQGPQERSDKKLGLMTPQSTLAPFETSVNSKTNRVIVKLSLNDAIARALANSTDIAVVSYSPSISRQAVIEAAADFDFDLTGGWGYSGTKYKPLKHNATSGANIGLTKKTIYGTNLSLTGEFNRHVNPLATTPPYSSSDVYTNQVSLQITQPLLRGFGTDFNLYNLRIARLNYKISESEFRQQVLTTINQVSNAYYALILARKEVEIAQRLYDKTIAVNKLLKGRATLDVTNIELSQTRATINTRKNTLITSQKALIDAEEALARILSDSQINVLKSPEIIPTTNISETKLNIDVADQLATALRLSPTLEQARLAIRQSELTVKFAKNDLLPSLNLVAGYTPSGSAHTRNAEWNELLKSSNYGYNVGFTFEYPIGNRARKARLESARLGRLQSRVQIQQAADLLAQQIKERIRQVELSYESLQYQRKAYKAYQDQMEAFSARYGINDTGQIDKRAGIKDLNAALFSLFLQIQADIALAETGIIRAKVQYNSALKDLQALTGELLLTNRVKLALPIAKPLPEKPDNKPSN